MGGCAGNLGGFHGCVGEPRVQRASTLLGDVLQVLEYHNWMVAGMRAAAADEGACRSNNVWAGLCRLEHMKLVQCEGYIAHKADTVGARLENVFVF